MSTSISTSPMTTSELLAMPENDGIDRDLIAGELRERPMTRRNPRHSTTCTLISHRLQEWLNNQPAPKGAVMSGEAGLRLTRNPDTLVGVDVVYISAELSARTPRQAAFVDGAPVLAVEILSPSDKHEEIVEKIEVYLRAGVKLVWVVDPDLRTIAVHRPDAPPVLFNQLQELTAEPHLPGFRVPVAELFPQ